jgi:hypothetical protein
VLGRGLNERDCGREQKSRVGLSGPDAGNTHQNEHCEGAKGTERTIHVPVPVQGSCKNGRIMVVTTGGGT